MCGQEGAAPQELIGLQFYNQRKRRGGGKTTVFLILFFLTIYLIFGCDGPLLLCLGFLQVWGLGPLFVVEPRLLTAVASLTDSRVLAQ